MDKETFISQIIEKLNLTPNIIVKKKYGKLPSVTLYELLEAIWEDDSNAALCTKFNVSHNTITRLLKKTFPHIRVTGGYRTWQYALLDLIGYKVCTACFNIFSHSKFYISNDLDRLSKTGSTCKRCNDELRLEHFKAKPELRRAIKAKRRATKLQATPIWADNIKITKFYTACPEGYEVDHIIPLQGQSVCGLHVENNLQYLTISDNRKKGNKLLPEYTC